MSERARAKAPKAIRTTDVERPRTLALSALGAAAGVSIAIAADGTPLATERPIARPHAKVACASCHTEGAGAAAVSTAPALAASTPALGASAPAPAAHVAAACKTCHGTSHASTRPAHRSLAAKGELTCATCHAQHAGAQGVTFEADRVVRWGVGSEIALAPSRRSGVTQGAIASGTTVPLVSLAPCAKCHDPSRAADPIAACVPAGARALAAAAAASAGAGSGGERRPDARELREVPSQCFDEHAKLGDRPGASGGAARGPVCASQHTDARFVAWDAAREVAATTAWVAPATNAKIPWTPAAGALAGGLVLGAAATAVDRRRRRAGAEPKAKTPAVPAARKRLPTVDPTTCLGCYACVDACPFDVLTIDRYVAVVARPEECCGVVLCEQVCPNGSLRVEDGEPIVDRPATDDELESRDVPGLFLAGDLTGLPLIKNAINQGVRVIDRIAATLPRRSAEPLDVLVIGAGPAGLSAALRAKEKGLSCVVVEQATVAASIKSFPRDKIVHDPPLDLPIEGELWLRQATKEELLAQWTRIVRARALDVREGHRVVDLAKRDGGFVVTAEETDVRADPAGAGSRGDDRAAAPARKVELRAARVVLAIGRRGTPRRLELDVEPGAEDRVLYALADARSFEGKRVVVVGLGDSAMEAALALARQPGTSVTISYRGTRFARGKAKNIAELEGLVAKRRIKVLFETVPVAISRTAVTLGGTGPHGGRRSVGADAMLVLVGGVPAWDLLTRAGIRRPQRQDGGP
ncbi:MAG: NAD(P)-binding domain-containing protein [Labilithrix sp.]|nr:NAD(P)-binding domain-containing protein [Labilithrix sp.]